MHYLTRWTFSTKIQTSVNVRTRLLTAGVLPQAVQVEEAASSPSISSVTSSPVTLGCWPEFPPLVPPRGVVIIKAIMFFKYRDIPDGGHCITEHTLLLVTQLDGIAN